MGGVTRPFACRCTSGETEPYDWMGVSLYCIQFCARTGFTVPASR